MLETNTHRATPPPIPPPTAWKAVADHELRTVPMPPPLPLEADWATVGDDEVGEAGEAA